MKYIALITGASSGIGREFVYAIDQSMDSIDEIWLVARRKDRLEEVSQRLRHHTRIICGDLAGRITVNRIATHLKNDKCRVRFLVNAAGYGILGDFDKGDRRDETGMCDINVRALTDLTHVCIPYMSKGSRIINLASSAAFVPQTGFSVYAATKAYVLSFSRSLNSELKAKGIYVTAVCPGPVRTEFFEIAEKNGNKTLSLKKIAMTTPQKVVKCALRDSYNKKEISVPTFIMKMFRIMCKVLPPKAIIAATSMIYK